MSESVNITNKDKNEEEKAGTISNQTPSFIQKTFDLLNV